jgi:hypothetical protein
MSDDPEVRVFDSVTAAVENSLPPVPPPYSVIENPQTAVSGPETPEQVPVVQKPSGRRTPAKPGGVKAQAGSARVQAKAQDPE